MSEEIEPNINQSAESKSFSGRYLIGGIFCFAVVMTATLFIYWKLHTGPFLPLQQALAAEFDGCQPMVQGGQRKMHKDSPKILRITMRVEFNPLEITEASQKHVSTVSQFIANNWELSEYNELHLHFYKKNPEKKLQENIFELNVEELLSGNSSI